jgi:beta-glucosidase
VHPTDGNAPLPTPDGLANSRAWLHLTQGSHAIQVDEVADASQSPVQVRLSWLTPSQRARQLAAAVAAARAAETAVVFVWSDGDLSKPLPDAQDQLVAAVAAANANTLVVLNTSQPVAMPWIGRVKAVLQMWYPGDEGGWATADVLLGLVNPSGHLPFTWPSSLEQTVAHQAQHPERASKGVGGSGECAAFGAQTGHNCGLTQYTEGVHVGYRHFDATDQTPLYPFGFGLSYTTFAFNDLTIQGDADHGLTVLFRVHNTGSRAGEVVPQVYLGPPTQPQSPAHAQFAERTLAGFKRVAIPAGASTQVSVRVEPRQLQYWSVTQGWTYPRGPRTLYVAHDARRIALTQDVAADMR